MIFPFPSFPVHELHAHFLAGFLLQRFYRIRSGTRRKTKSAPVSDITSQKQQRIQTARHMKIIAEPAKTPFRDVIFRLFFIACSVRGHQIMIPVNRIRTNISVLTPTIIFPRKNTAIRLHTVQQPAMQPEHSHEKNAGRSYLPLISPVY